MPALASEASKMWKADFDGEPAFPPSQIGWSVVLKFDHKQCDPWAVPMNILVRNYDAQVYAGDALGADITYRKIHQILFEELGEKNACFKAAAFSYALNSLYWIDNTGFWAEKWATGQQPTRQKALLFAALINRGKAAILTPSDREALGGIWARTTKKGTPTVLGAYDCGSSMVSLDILQRPLDEGATIIHELDHLMRDKLLAPDEYPEFSDDPEYESHGGYGISGRARGMIGNVPWQDFVLMDESYAVAYAALLQLRYRRSPYFEEPFGDLSFSLTHGPASRMESAARACEGNFWKDSPSAAFHYSVSTVLLDLSQGYQDNICWDDGRTRVAKQVERTENLVLQRDAKAIYRTVFGAYFPRRDPVEMLRELDLKTLQAQWGGLFGWDVVFPDRFREPSSDCADPQWREWRESTDGMWACDLESRIWEGVHAVDIVLSTLDRPSTVCQGYRANFNSVVEAGYLDGFDPIREEKGVKGETLLQLEKGVKGEDGLLRLCVDLEHKI